MEAAADILSLGLSVFWFIIALFHVYPLVIWQPEKIVPFGLSKKFNDHWIIIIIIINLLASLKVPMQEFGSITLAQSEHSSIFCGW